MTAFQLSELGFKIANGYTHDGFLTQDHVKGNLRVSMTYKNGQLVSSDMTITEVEFFPVSIEHVKKVSEFFDSL